MMKRFFDLVSCNADALHSVCAVDTDSSKVLDIIFSNRLAEIAIVYNRDDCTFYCQNVIWSGNDIVSYMESRRGAFETAAQETLDGFADTME